MVALCKFLLEELSRKTTPGESQQSSTRISEKSLKALDTFPTKHHYLVGFWAY